MEEYSHPDHGEMKWVEYTDEIKGWRCEDCHVIGHPERADDVFDEYDCGQYKRVRKGIKSSA
jgi:Zn-finger protein